MRSWHDYHLTGYGVDGIGSRITFDISWPYNTSADIGHALLVFSGVVGYYFEHDLGTNILYSIEERPLGAFLSENSAYFAEQKKWGWPLFWRKGAEEAARQLKEHDVKCFEIASSYGLSGWILATTVEHHEKA